MAHGPKWSKNGLKTTKNYFLALLGPFFSPFRAVGHFFFFVCEVFPPCWAFGPLSVRLTRKTRSPHQICHGLNVWNLILTIDPLGTNDYTHLCVWRSKANIEIRLHLRFLLSCPGLGIICTYSCTLVCLSTACTINCAWTH